MYQWAKRSVKNFEAKKENCKVNGRLQKLISEIKSKRESLAAVQTGFPSSVASFVAHSHLGWIPSNGDTPTKKKRWHSTKKASKKAEAEKAQCPPAEVHVPRPNPLSLGEISEQICIDPQLAGPFGDDLQSVGQLGNDPQSVGQSGNDPQSLSQLGNDPQSVDVILERNFNDRIVEQVNAVGQLGANLASENTARLYPLYIQLFAVILVIIMSISVVLDTKKAAVGITLIVFLVHRVVFKSQEPGSTNRFFPSTNFTASILPSICGCKNYNNPGQEERVPCDELKLLNCRDEGTSETILPNNSSEPCTSTSKAAPESFTDLPLTQKIGIYTTIPKQPLQGVKMSRSKLFKNFVFQKSASAPTSPHARNEVMPTGKVLSSPSYPSPKSCSTSLVVQRELTSSESVMQRELKRKKDQALKFGHSLFSPCQINLECGSCRIGAECSDSSYVAISVLLIIVLIGLMAGRLPAIVLALSWCFFMKFVEIGWHYIARQSQDSGAVLKGRSRSVC